MIELLADSTVNVNLIFYDSVSLRKFNWNFLNQQRFSILLSCPPLIALKWLIRSMTNRLFQCLLTYLRTKNDIVLARKAAHSNIYDCIFSTDTSMHLLWASRIGGRCSFLPPSQLARRFYSSTHSWSYLAPDVAGRRAEALAAGDAEKSDDGPMSIVYRHIGVLIVNRTVLRPIEIFPAYDRQ